MPLGYLLVSRFRGRYKWAMAWGGAIQIGLSCLALYAPVLIYGPDPDLEAYWITYLVWFLVNACALAYYVGVLFWHQSGQS